MVKIDSRTEGIDGDSSPCSKMPIDLQERRDLEWSGWTEPKQEKKESGT
jgi:hypothetical protein